jgi:FkbM family methyltransferase
MIMLMKPLLKKLYDLIPFKKEIFSVLRKIWIPPVSIYQHLHFKGVFKVTLDEGKSFKIRHYGFQLENELFWRGISKGWESVSINLWMNLCKKKSSVIIDIGANTGIYTLIARTMNPEAQIHTFEPVKRVFEKLEQNIRLNQYSIHLHEKAVSDNDGYATIFDQLTEHIYSVTVNKNTAPSNIAVVETRVETVTLDTFIAMNNIQHIDLIKIDVETHEPAVIRGFKKHLAAFKPVMLIEILTDEIGREVQDAVDDCGYLYFNIDEKGAVRRVHKVVASDYYNYLFCGEQTARDLGIL